MEELQELINGEEYDFRFDLGIAIPVNKIRLEDTELLVSSMAKHFAVLKVKAELDQIICGMVIYTECSRAGSKQFKLDTVAVSFQQVSKLSTVDARLLSSHFR